MRLSASAQIGPVVPVGTGALPPPAKYVDHSYVEEALKELGRR